MKADEWYRVKVVEDISNYNLKLGDKFLYGSKVANQKETKKIGDKITYYEVIKIDGNSVQYVIRIENLEEVRFKKDE